MKKHFSRDDTTGLNGTVEQGDPGAVSSTPLGSRSGLRDTTWPAPTADLWRSGAALDGGPILEPGQAELATTIAELPHVPFFGATYDDETVFILGGSTFLMEELTAAYLGKRVKSGSDSEDPPVNPYVAKINTANMEYERVELPLGPSVNYIGEFLMHENGNVYVVATSTFFEIDPERMTVTRSLDLPLLEEYPESTIYNGLQVSPRNGDIILKMCDYQGRTANGLIMSVKLDDMSIRAQTEAAMGRTRITIALHGDMEYVYMPGLTETLRFAVSDRGIELDTDWSVTYRAEGDGSTQAGAVVYMGHFDSVVYADNGTFTQDLKNPVTVYSQSTTGTRLNQQTAVKTRKAGGTFAGVSGDPFESGAFIVQDSVNGIVAGWRLDQDGNLKKLWEADQYMMTAGPAVSVARRHAYIDHRECNRRGKRCTYSLIVLDLLTGEEIARAELPATVPTVGHLFVSADAVFHIATEGGKESGFVTRVSRR